ncbi:MAG: DUF997 family protein [Pseudomonadota bacterium]
MPKSERSAADRDRVWQNSRRESIWILVISAAFMAWTVGFSYQYGYGVDAAIDLTFGIPTWVFWGIAVPWVVAIAVSIYFAICVIRDDPLDDDTFSPSEEKPR